MKYGKIIDNTLQYAPNPIWTSTEMIANPTAEQYISFGYKPIIETAMPIEEGYYFTATYTETATEIVQGWERHEVIEYPTATDYEKSLAELGVQ